MLLRLLVVLCLAVSMPVMAHEAGSWVVRVGAAEVAPDTDSDAIDVAGLVTLPGVDVGDNPHVDGQPGRGSAGGDALQPRH